MQVSECLICRSKAKELDNLPYEDHRAYECPNCGKYILNEWAWMEIYPSYMLKDAVKFYLNKHKESYRDYPVRIISTSTPKEHILIKGILQYENKCLSDIEDYYCKNNR